MPAIARLDKQPTSYVDLFIPRYRHFESAAAFFAWLAYTGKDQAVARQRFWKLLCRYYVHWLADHNADFRANGTVPISYAFVDSDDQALWRGMRQIFGRYCAGKFGVVPHLKEMFTGQRQRINGFTPTVNNMIKQVRYKLSDIGWKSDSDSDSTAKTKIWKPTWPVAHAAAAFAHCCDHNEFLQSYKTYDLHEAILLFMTDEMSFVNLLGFTELFRLFVPKIKLFHITDDMLVQFQYNRIDWSPQEVDKYFIPNLIKLKAVKILLEQLNEAAETSVEDGAT